MLLVVVLAALVCWWLSDEPARAAPPATAPTQTEPAPPPPAATVYKVGAGQLPAGQPTVAHFHQSHQLVAPPPIPCKEDRGPA